MSRTIRTARLSPIVKIFPLFLLFACISLPRLLFAEDLPPRYLVELRDELADDLRHDSRLLVVQQDEISLVPLFNPPPDKAKLPLWRKHGLHRWYRVTPDGMMPEAAQQAIREIDGVLSLAESPLVETESYTPDDFDNYNLWGLLTMDLPEAWDIYHGDSDVLVSAMDTGLRLDHEDLLPRLYINPGEDVNGDGLWTDVDNNNIDDDQNGYVDDICGWDFVDHDEPDSSQVVGEDYGPPDNRVDPDVHGHGTLVSGTLAAATDNQLGIASAAFRTNLVPIRCGFARSVDGSIQGNGYSDAFAVALQYAADNGIRIVNVSFSGSDYLQAWQDAINYAWDSGTLFFAAAGNASSDTLVYPAGYDHAIAVASTAPGDVRSSFSNYGEWVDIAAPGSTIYTTVNWGVNSYTGTNGTSFASPNTASVAALALAMRPELTPQQLVNAMQITSNNIDALNPGYVGQLGAGRVNAARLLHYIQNDFLPFPYDLSFEVNSLNGELSLDWLIDNDREDLIDFAVYADGVRLDSTNHTSITTVLPEPGILRVGVTARFAAGESISGEVLVDYNGSAGIPFESGFEEGNLLGWQKEVNGDASSIQLQVEYGHEGRYHAAVRTSESDFVGLTRPFTYLGWLEASGWFQLNGDAAPETGQAASIELEGEDNNLFQVFMDEMSYPSYRLTEAGGVTRLSEELVLPLAGWLGIYLKYTLDHMEVLYLDEQGFPIFHTRFATPQTLLRGVRFGARDISGPQNMDNLSIRSMDQWYIPFPGPVDPTERMHGIVIQSATLNDTPLEAGDQIRLYDGDLFLTLTEIGDFSPYVLTAYGESGDSPGFTDGHNFRFSVIRRGTGMTHPAWATILNGSESFAEGGLTSMTLSVGDVSVEERPAEQPSGFTVSPAWPNPFNASTRVEFVLPARGRVQWQLINMLGQQVSHGSLMSEAGPNHLVISEVSTHTLASGSYFLKLKAGKQVRRQKLVLLK